MWSDHSHSLSLSKVSRTPSNHLSVDASKEAREIALNQTRRRLVLEGAWRVFARDGLDGATMRGIAAEAGCTTGAIYPLFSSKEAVYAALLAESLERLHRSVDSAVVAAKSPRKKLQAAALAFLTYYRDRPDEVALGLYLWHGLRPRGLNLELDAELNRGLDATLALLRGALGTLGNLNEASVRVETSALFAFLIGALIVHQTGRLRLLDSDLDSIAASHLEALSRRMESAETGT
jgi:TetR/AcrR family transcriptional regulator